MNLTKSKSKNCVSNTIYKSRFQELENQLNILFKKESELSDSIFVYYSDSIIKKLAMFLSGVTSRPAAIGVCGETASGKSTIVMDSVEIIENFVKNFSQKTPTTRINTDDYYYDRSKEVRAAGSFAEFAKNYDLDVPEAIELSLMKKHIQILLDNQEVMLPKYDMSGTAIRLDNCLLTKPSSIIIAEGIYALNSEISDIFDFKIYVDIDKNIQKERFFERAKQRNLGDSAQQIFDNASIKAQKYVHCCAKSADIVLNGAISREKYKKFVKSLLNVVECNCTNFAV